jgi:hypothetical protein
MRVGFALLMWTVTALAASACALADEAPQTPTQVAVAGRWLSLPLPNGFCALDQNDPTQNSFAELQWRQSHDSGRQVLYPFAHCGELKEFRSKGRLHFAFGSYDAIQAGEAAFALPPDLAPEAFLDYFAQKSPKEFNLPEVESLLSAIVERGDAPIVRSGLFARTPDASYVAVFQRISTGRKKHETMSAFGMTGITVVAGVPVIVALMRFDATGTGVYEELLASEKAIIAALHAANSPAE